jgi:hypothetical protein
VDAMCERRRLTAVGPRPLRVLKSGLWQVWQRDVRTQLLGLSCRPRSPSPATRCTTPQNGGSKASPSLWHRKWRSSASVSRLSSGAAHAPNSVTAVHRSPRRCRSTRAPLPAPSSGCPNRRTARPRRSGPDGESDHRRVDVEPAPLRIVLRSQALESTIATLEKRIVDFEARKVLLARESHWCRGVTAPIVRPGGWTCVPRDSPGRDAS